MENNPNNKLLRIFIGESDRHHQQPLYERIVFEAKKAGLSGATVTRGIMGFGANSKVHTAKLFELSSDLRQLFEESSSGGLITLEKAEVIRYQPGHKKQDN
jgi:PII-like signaling protein